MSTPEWQATISSAREDVDRDRVFHYLHTESYWAKGIPRDVFERSIDNSLCYSAHCNGEMIGFARIVTDKAVFAYLADVYVEEAWRGKGISKLLLDAIMGNPHISGLRRFMLATADAHDLYARYGFSPIETPERLMQILQLDLYEGE